MLALAFPKDVVTKATDFGYSAVRSPKKMSLLHSSFVLNCSTEAFSNCYPIDQMDKRQFASE